MEVMLKKNYFSKNFNILDCFNTEPLASGNFEFNFQFIDTETKYLYEIYNNYD